MMQATVVRRSYVSRQDRRQKSCFEARRIYRISKEIHQDRRGDVRPGCNNSGDQSTGFRRKTGSERGCKSLAELRFGGRK